MIYLFAGELPKGFSGSMICTRVSKEEDLLGTGHTGKLFPDIEFWSDRL